MTFIYDASLKTLWVSLDIVVPEDDVVGSTRSGGDNIEGILGLETLEVDAGAGEVGLDWNEATLVLLRGLENVLVVVGVVVGGELVGRQGRGRGRGAFACPAPGGRTRRDGGEGGAEEEEEERGAAAGGPEHRGRRGPP